MTPLNGKVLIAPEWMPKQVGSIIMPENLAYRDLPNTGTVVSVPADFNGEFNIGDRVLFDHRKSSIEHCKDDSEKPLSLVPVDDVMAVLH